MSKSPMGASVPNPNLSDNMLAFSLAQSVFAALGNNVSAVAAATGNAAAPTYTAISAPSLNRKSSGKFICFGEITIDKNAGSLVAGDAVVLVPQVNGVTLGTGQFSTAAITSGATVQAAVPFGFLASTAVAVGAAVVISMLVNSVSTSHTSAVLINNGWITVVELPA